ncbi:DUF1045 domain-containing protein [Microbacterium sp.]|uniref:DUF1045 domain-containing protein n=1 Tax=Microbacterium sp. TaxID=51671 RepID=UPI003C73FE75
MTRYAVYALPGALGTEDDLAAVRLRDLAERWFSREDTRAFTTEPRRYGFHGTLKAPFCLAEGRTEEHLRDAASAFASRRAAVPLIGLAVTRIGRFRALSPGGSTAGVDGLAADAVREFDALRAPLDDADIARRRPETMSDRQRELFRRWGYPYVFDEFRFHLTLTDSIPDKRVAEVDTAVREHFASVHGADVQLRSIALFREPAPGEPFSLLSVHPFAPSQEA